MDWIDLAERWIASEARIEAAHAPVAEALLAASMLAEGEKVLDIGCGSGATSLMAARAVGPAGAVIGSDISDRMTERLAERAQGLDHVSTLPANAQTHVFESDHDAVMSLFGVMFFDDSAAAFANIARALRPGGRMVFACWAGPPVNPWFSVLGRAAATHVPEMPPPDPSAPGPMRFADIAYVTDLLTQAGLTDVSAVEHALHLTPSTDPAGTVDMLLHIGPLRGAVAQLSPPGTAEDRIAAIAADAVAGFTAFDGDDGLKVPCVIRIFSAQRPS